MPDPKPDDIVGAIHALTTYLRNGSATPDPRAFTPGQLRIQRDFRFLLTGFGRAAAPDRPDRLPRPTVLATGQLRLAAPLPPEATEIGGYTRRRAKVWRVTVAAATSGSGAGPTDLRHKDITTPDVARIWVFAADGRPILVGTPEPVSAVPGPVIT